MAVSQKTTINATITVKQVETDDVTDGVINTADQAAGATYEWPDGTTAQTTEGGAAQADTKFRKTSGLGAGASVVFDLDALSEFVFGNTVTIAFAKIRAIIIRNLTLASTGRLVVGGNASNAWIGPFGAANDTIEVPNKGVLILTNPTYTPGWPVTAGTGDLLKLANPGAGAVEYEIQIIGTSV